MSTIKTDEYAKTYEIVLETSMAQNSPYDKAMQTITAQFEKYEMSDEAKFQATMQTISTMVQNITATSQQIALQLVMESERLALEAPLKAKELELAEKRLLLADKEAEFNEKRAELLKAQTQKELKSIEAIQREITHYDDKLRIQEATMLKDVVFGYTAGGLVPPTDMTTKALDAIDKITP